MRIKEIIAEWHYLKDMKDNPVIPFCEQESNVRDAYFRIAGAELPQLLGGYFGNKGGIE